jgi:hypothetical protein
MATRSRIAIELSDGTVKSVYCHWDGYFDGVGKDLMARFPNGTDPINVEFFINEGDRSTVEMSYNEWRNENCPADEVESVSEFFNGDIEEYGYLYTQDGHWITKQASNRLSEPFPLGEYTPI